MSKGSDEGSGDFVTVCENLRFKGIENTEEVYECILRGEDIWDVFLLCRTENRNIMEIMEMSEAFCKYYAGKNIEIFGAAYKKQNAYMLAKDIIEEYYIKHKTIKGLKESLA